MSHAFPPQSQPEQPGKEHKMRPPPDSAMEDYQAAGKLKGKVAVITGGDSGIGRAVSVGFAKEGADVAILYFNEHEDADKTRQLVEKAGRKCILYSGDIGDESWCRATVREIVGDFGDTIDILVNNAAEQHETESIAEISAAQLERTFRTNIFAMFYLTKAALPHMKEGGSIINTTSVTAYRGSGHLLDYSTTKGAIVAFTRSLSQQLNKKGIRVNAVAPGPIWTPLIPASFPPENVASFGEGAPMGRAGQPDEVAPSYIFLAGNDASYMTGQVLHPNGGEIVNG